MRLCQECNKEIPIRSRIASFCTRRCYDIARFSEKPNSRWMTIGLSSSYEAMLEVHQMFKG